MIGCSGGETEFIDDGDTGIRDFSNGMVSARGNEIDVTALATVHAVVAGSSIEEVVAAKSIVDGINLGSSRIEIRRSLCLDVQKTSATDRDLFDFETDDGGSFVELPRGCWVRLNGVFW